MTEHRVVPKTLIVPVDGSEVAERGVACARVLAARLAACDVVLLAVDVDDGERMRAYVEELAARSADGARMACGTGDPAGEILRTARREPDGVICMTTRGRGRLGASLLGSVATDVVRNADGPVVLVGPRVGGDWWHDPARLVVCWAGDGSDAVLAPAQAWSTALGMELSLLTVFHPLDVPASVEPEREFAPARAQLDARHRDAPAVALRHEHPPGAIVEYAATLPATMLALTTHARAGVGRAVLGSAAMDVVRHSPCPALVVRHEP